jgi:hypothetical protein
VIARHLFAVAVAGAALLAHAGQARADESKGRAPDLTALKDAVAAANKRGENVEAIREALAAFEKALAKGAAKPGEAPPELAALREAVETAARKGENVAAISTELGAVEKALTGRAYERPKPPEPRPEPAPERVMPAFPQRRPPGGFGGRGVIGPGAGFNSTSVTIVNGVFTVKAKQGDVTYVVTGSTNGTEPTKITIEDGQKKIEADDVKKVPEQYQPTVERLLKIVTVNR